MKKYLFGLLILLLSCSAHAAGPASNTLTLSVFVQGSFGMMVDTNSFDFATLTPGQSGEMSRASGIVVACQSGSGDPWYLKVAATPLSSGSDYIPNDNFSWYGTSEGKGTWKAQTERTFKDNGGTAYVSSVTEAQDAIRVANRFKFKLFVPEATRPGEYRSQVLFTMTE